MPDVVFEIPAEIRVLSAASATRCGEKHASNQDACAVLRGHGLFVVADGMGGHRDGALASAMIVERLEALAQTAPMLRPETVAACLEQANRAIFDLGNSRSQVTASTVAALLVDQDRFTGFWAGDSRIYQLRGGALRQLSKDHSEVQDLVDHGVLSAEKALTWPRRNVITRAIGVGETVELARVEGALADDDAFVLCSDGLTTRVDHDEIQDLTLALAPQPACDALVDLAKRRGERDDITVVIVRFGLPSSQAAVGVVR